eukprot:CAMPEP_0114636734 /NCGR_PEP_ID=MMETSP0168-20121206/17136_1 /TAXON_ID=95228 ORGANISM="Vannella sp., Strain DIVA3 517/6/12" /NCGR_SAMPLE_ID=MMETSP0168 /ASSEMBLY_ACC=CAM_ASM_000044 /LENGTH=252 /DNA_ID=CAMNT_0001848451 /DNA_START=24 /DNA_END=783 /DNA_ORIENTATION=-
MAALAAAVRLHPRMRAQSAPAQVLFVLLVATGGSSCAYLLSRLAVPPLLANAAYVPAAISAWAVMRAAPGNLGLRLYAWPAVKLLLACGACLSRACTTLAVFRVASAAGLREPLDAAAAMVAGGIGGGEVQRVLLAWAGDRVAPSQLARPSWPLESSVALALAWIVLLNPFGVLYAGPVLDEAVVFVTTAALLVAHCVASARAGSTYSPALFSFVSKRLAQEQGLEAQGPSGPAQKVPQPPVDGEASKRKKL